MLRIFNQYDYERKIPPFDFVYIHICFLIVFKRLRRFERFKEKPMLGLYNCKSLSFNEKDDLVLLMSIRPSKYIS